MAASIPLSLTVPAAAAVLGYANARFHLSRDLSMMATYINVQLSGAFAERRDTLNLFYTLESWAQNSKTRDNVFIIYDGRSYTYRESYDTVLRYGTWMRQVHKVQPGEVVAMDFMNSDHFVWVWFGLWAIGAVPAFINYNLMDKPLLHSIKSSGTRLLIVDEAVRDIISENVTRELGNPDFREGGGSVQIVFFTPEVQSEIEHTLGKRESNACRSGQLLKDMSILIYTSGTTGLPKPAIVSWAKANVASKFASKWLPLKQGETLYTCMPLYHSSAAVLAVCSTLNAGSAICIGRRFNRTQFWEDVRSSNASVIQYVGETCRYLLSLPPSEKDKQNNVRLAFGNGLRPDVWPKFKERFGIETIAEFYAATEGPGGLFNKSTNSFSEGAVGMSGLVVATLLGGGNKVVKIDYETNEPIRDAATGFCIAAEPNTPGEMMFKLNEAEIDSTFQGYYRNAKATSGKVLRDVFAKGDAFFRTGDLMRHDSEGRYFFCDRIGDTFRWKSENVSTSEVGEVLGNRNDLIDEPNVYGVEIPNHDGRAGCAALLLAPDHQAKLLAQGEVEPALLKELAAYSIANLPRYAVPVFLRVLRDEESAHRTGTNKQQKHVFRTEGVDPDIVEAQGDRIYWLKPGGTEYEKFSKREWKMLQAGQVKL